MYGLFEDVEVSPLLSYTQWC